MGKQWIGIGCGRMVALLLAVGLLLGAGPAWAGEADDLAKEANKELRNAQRAMFRGKHEDTLAGLTKVNGLLEKLKAADPNHRQLKTLESKFNRLKKDLERRTKKPVVFKRPTQPEKSEAETLLKDIQAGLRDASNKMFNGKHQEAFDKLGEVAGLLEKTKGLEIDATKLKTVNGQFAKLKTDIEKRMGKTVKPIQTTTTTTTKPTTTKPGKLPYSVRQHLRELNMLFRQVDHYLAKFEGHKTEAGPNMAKQLKGDLDEAARNLAKLQPVLDKMKAAAAAKGVTEHPDLTAWQKRVDDGAAKLKQSKVDADKAVAARTASSKAVGADVAKLTQEAERLQKSVFQLCEYGLSLVKDKSTAAELTQQLAQIEAFEKDELPKLKTLLADFEKKYGPAADMRKKLEKAGYEGQSADAARTFEKLNKSIANVAKARTATGADLVKRVNSSFDSARGRHDFYFTDIPFDMYKAFAELAPRFDPVNADAKKAAGTVDQRIKDAKATFKARIDKRTWPAHAANAPNNAKGLAAAALDWFKKSPDWGSRPAGKVPRKPLAVVVTGPWSIQARNILGQPTMYGLPVRLAVIADEKKEKGLARVYILTMRTAEHAGVKMAPPFDSITVGNSYYIRTEAVK